LHSCNTSQLPHSFLSLLSSLPRSSALFPYTTLFRSDLRGGKVFIDWSQNTDTKTTVAVYSLRAKQEGPFVSFPIDWDRSETTQTDRKSTRLNSSHDQISYAVFCLKKKKKQNETYKQP